MVKSLRESKAKLSELVQIASQGEDVLISVRGKLKARLTRVQTSQGAGNLWARELEQLQKQYATGHHRLNIEKIIDEDRSERN